MIAEAGDTLKIYQVQYLFLPKDIKQVSYELLHRFTLDSEEQLDTTDY